MSSDNKELKDKLLSFVRNALQQDADLRGKFQIGDKFRFIRDRLSALQTRVKETFAQAQQETVQKRNQPAEDEVLVYVYLFNAQGLSLQTWRKMVHPSVFYEHSVNRPVYMDKTQIETMIRGKSNPVLHGYLTVAVKKSDVIPKRDDSAKDSLGNPLIKIREGSLSSGGLMSFTHNGNVYDVNEEGELVMRAKG